MGRPVSGCGHGWRLLGWPVALALVRASYGADASTDEVASETLPGAASSSPSSSTASGGPVAVGPRLGGRLVDPDRLPLHTQGRFIVDRLGERVKWACVNAYGADSETYVIGGAEVVSIKHLAFRIMDLGFNCVRLPYSVEAFVKNPPVNKHFVAANPELAGRTFLEVFDATVTALTDQGLMIIMDNHVSTAGWCCHMSQREGLWYTEAYNEEAWISTLVNVTARYMTNPLVVGIGLRNEPHDWLDVKLSWGDGNPETDWALAATKAANAVLAVNPKVVIPIMSLCSGMCLIPAKTHPIKLNVPNRVIYETHNYLEYVFVNIIPEDLITWAHVHLIINILICIVAMSLVLLLWFWWTGGRPIPSWTAVLPSIGYCWCGLGVLGLILVSVAVKAVSHFCYWWAMNGVFWWYKYPIFLLLLGGAFISLGKFGKRILRKAGADSDSESEDEPSWYPGGQDEGKGFLPKKNASELSLQESGGAVPVLTNGFHGKTWNRTLHGVTCCCFALSVLTHLNKVVAYLASYDFCRDFLDDKWGFITEEGQPYTAPIWVGEFSYENEGPAWQHLVRYLAERDMDFGFWAVNGKKYGTGYMSGHTGQYTLYRYCDNEYGCDLFEHDGGVADGRCDLNSMEGTNCAPQLSVGDDGVCSYQVSSGGRSCAEYCELKGRTCVRGSALTGQGVCQMTEARPVADIPVGEGCDAPAEEQVCTCSKLLWRWDNETFGILSPDYNTVGKAWRLRDLQALGSSPATWTPRDIACRGDYRGKPCE
eukprot:TRINITY_DN3292_c0_g3_i1.p1 TRINITY_DN3292_c0_g3~~TRINITY_DN3292_c0_g3_i1.p1  ORF type:complete len:788 (+),score=111.73 TRINITY_DN3292_c0_g3_i1:72-2366(+)